MNTTNTMRRTPTRGHPIPRKAIWACIAVLIVAFVFWFPSIWSERSTNPNAYPKILHRLQRDFPDAFDHMPAAIPADATNVVFFYQWGALQGGVILELQYTASPAEVKRVLNDAASTKFRSRRPERWNWLVKPLRDYSRSPEDPLPRGQLVVLYEDGRDSVSFIWGDVETGELFYAAVID
jgi:hypothetical protein